MTRELTPDEVKKINELLAPAGWTVGQIYRARRLEIVQAQETKEKEERAAYVRAHYPDEPGFIDDDPEYAAALARLNDLIYEP